MSGADIDIDTDAEVSPKLDADERAAWPTVDRQAVRALLVDPAGCVLLLRCKSGSGGPDFWITPGGGIDPGESPEQALRRELREELGLDLGDAPPGPWVWERTHTFPWAPKRAYLRQHERFVLLRLDARPVTKSHRRTEEETDVLLEDRWWRIDEILQATGDGLLFAPRRLGALLLELRQGPPPNGPIDVGE